MLPESSLMDVSYFPGCSLATTARENNQSLVECSRKLGMNLIELPDWNCCGSSSAHSIRQKTAFDLAARNLSLAPPGRALVVACPSCLMRLEQARYHLNNDKSFRERYHGMWGRPYDPLLELRPFFKLLEGFDFHGCPARHDTVPLNLKFVPYYGCMLNRPFRLRPSQEYHGIMEKTLAALGLEPLTWGSGSKCCGTFLTVARPDVITPKVNAIMEEAIDAGAECIITACAMCHMNLEVRCALKRKIPIFHFSEILSLAFGTTRRTEWFSRHLIDPSSLLKKKGLL